jgi:hypothetical protein
VTTASVGIAGGGNVRINGVAEGGTLVTVDGTDATANPETRGMSQYGGQGQISVMSIEAVAEVQIVKGILPAEYGGVTGGQVNMISRSGTNEFHGSLFENYQHEALFARATRLTHLPKPKVRFNQFGGSLGGPIVRNRVFFFGAYEGYREQAGIEVSGTVPTEITRNQVLAAQPLPETRILLEALPLPVETIVTAAGVVREDVGRWRGARNRERRDNALIVKGDLRLFEGNLSVTHTRMRPYTVNPGIYVGPGNDEKFFNKSDRIAAQYVVSRGAWVSESRFGWNDALLDRAQDFWFVQDPSREPETEITNASRRMPMFNITGLFNTVTSEALHMESRSYSAEQKLSRIMGAHNVKLGFRWSRQGGQKTNPMNPSFGFQSFADFAANIPNSVNLYAGQPPHAAHLDEYGAFIQDDWRLSSRLMLNLGLRYDYHPTFRVKSRTDAPAQLYNLEPPSDLRLMDFGPARDPNKPYDPNRLNLGPRVGFVWTVDRSGDTVVRLGSGVLFSQQMYATLQNMVSNPFVPNRVTWNRRDVQDQNLKWPMYGDQLSRVALQNANGRAIVYGLIHPDLPSPHTIQSMVNVQRTVTPSVMVEAGYVRTDGRNFPLLRSLAQAWNRETGLRPNPVLGGSAGYYLTAEQSSVYNSLQLSVRKRFSSNFGFDVHYTLSEGWAEQGGGLSSNFVNSEVNLTQDFWNPQIDRAPLSQEQRHRFNGNLIYGVPWFQDGNGLLPHVLGGWQISSIFRRTSGTPLRITQTSGLANSRPDYIGGPTINKDWKDSPSFQYLNPAAFALVPTYATTNAPIRAGTSNPHDAYGPWRWNIDISLSKSFRIAESKRLQVRIDAFNALNHVNDGNPSTGITGAGFGQISNVSGNARTAQVGARFTF